jgi:membrane protease YdiL (CAAX protease family)
MPVDTPDENIPAEPLAIDVTPAEPPAHRESNLWSWNDLVLFLAFTAVAFLAASFFVTLGYVILKSLAGWKSSSPTDQANPIFLLTMQGVFYGALLAFIYLLIVTVHGQPFWSSLSWRKLSSGKTLGYFLGGIALAVIVQLASALLPDQGNFPLEKMFTSAQAAFAIAGFATLIAPFMEELVFRGVLFSIFERQAGLWFAIASTTVLFGALHIPEYQGAWNHTLLIFLVGAVFSLTRGLAKSVAPSFILHFAYNLSTMTALFFATHHFRTLQSVLAAAQKAALT